MNRERKVFLGWGTVFKRDIHWKEQKKQCWIGSGAKIIYKQRIQESLWCVCVCGGGGGGEEGNKDSKCALFDPSARA